MNQPTAVSPYEHLRRTRPWLLATGALLLLWMLLAITLVALPTARRSETTGTPFGELLQQNSLLYPVVAYIATHFYVGLKLVKLARAARQPETPEDRMEAARSFATFWKTNLRAHLILWAIPAVSITLAFLLRR
jgi:hypothetical protein